MLMLPVWSIFLVSLKIQNPEMGNLSLESIIVLTALTLIFAGAYFINQIYDYESDLANKKLGFLQRGMFSKSEMMAAYISASIVGLLGGFWVGTTTGIALLILLLLGFAYSAPPFRFKDRPIPGLISNAAAYGIILPLSIMDLINASNSLSLSLPAYFFLTVSAAYLLTIIPDRAGDVKSGKNTLAAYLPDKGLILLGMLLLILSLIVAWPPEYYYLMIISAVSFFLFFVALISGKIPLVLFACKFPILLMSCLAAYYFPFYIVFLVVLLFITRLYYKRRFGMKYPGLSR